MKWSPQHKKETSRKVTDYRPSSDEANANDCYCADTNRPDATKANAPNIQNDEDGKSPKNSRDYAIDYKIGLIGQIEATLEVSKPPIENAAQYENNDRSKKENG